MRISIIGAGAVGYAVGKSLINIGHNIVFCDIDPKKVKSLEEEGLEAVTDYILGDVTFVSVPTPTKNDKIDLSYVKSATKEVGKGLKNKESYGVIAVKSTIVPFTTEKILIPILERYSDRGVGRDFGVCYNPEFLTESHSSWTESESFKKTPETTDRIVIGEYDKRSGDMLEEVYKPFNVPIIRTNLRTAEMIKYASNCALASKISYSNEIHMLCDKLGIDGQLVTDVVGLDPRIGEYGSVSGKAFGGRCLPKDLQAFITFGKEQGYEPKFLEAIKEINEKMKERYGVRE